MTSTPTPQRIKLLEKWGAPLPRCACIYHLSKISSFTVILISKQMMEVVENVFMLTIRVLTQTAEFLSVLSTFSEFSWNNYDRIFVAYKIFLAILRNFLENCEITTKILRKNKQQFQENSRKTNPKISE